MNKKMIAYIIGVVLMIEGALMLLPLIVAAIYGEWNGFFAFLKAIGIVAAAGFLLSRVKLTDKTIHSKEGLVSVALCWIALSLGGALPFLISGEIPSFVDAFFETVSGFTTTGASILSNVEALSQGMLFWRSFTHWIGGMGVLVFAIAAVPLAKGGGNIHLMRAESPGFDVSKLVPNSRGTAFRLYIIYLVMTAIEVVLLLFAGNCLFDALTISFGTAGTGGFAIKNTSIALYSHTTQVIVTIFMAAFGVNFSCYYLILLGRFKSFFKNEELRVYIGILLVSTIVITFNIRFLCKGFLDALRVAAFQVSSVMTTTGYTTVDFNEWPELSRIIMIFIMCIGACVGSTGGGIKVARVIILFKEGFRQFKKNIFPNRVEAVRLDEKPVGDDVIRGISGFFSLYMLVFVVSALFLSLDSYDTVSNLSGIIATLNNIGPGLEVVGATGNYGTYNALSKMVFSADMLLGRLEIIPFFALFSPHTWRKH